MKRTQITHVIQDNRSKIWYELKPISYEEWTMQMCKGCDFDHDETIHNCPEQELCIKETVWKYGGIFKEIGKL